jgi:choline kinase
LGTFTNGRFEEYYNATPLTIAEMCEPEISVQIAEKVRDLHDGFLLHEKELDAGPFIWCIWDKWVERCERICTVLDSEIRRCKQTIDDGRGNDWRNSGLVCGADWSVFRKTVERYRDFLYKQYGGLAGTRSRLVFAHNDVMVPVCLSHSLTDKQAGQV